jgi:hypothetical protein
MLLPPPEGHCRICARKHDPTIPHDAQSLFYGTRFKMRYGREGTWADAIQHCPEDVRSQWRKHLETAGVWTEPPAGVEPICEPIDG